MWKRSACCAFFYFWNISVADLNNTFSQLNGLAGTNVVFFVVGECDVFLLVVQSESFTTNRGNKNYVMQTNEYHNPNANHF